MDKELFINECLKHKEKRAAIKLFDEIKVIEASKNMDFCNFDTNIMQGFINDICGNGYNSLLKIRILKLYIKWCQENDIPSTTAIFKVKIDAQEELRLKSVDSPEMLRKKLDTVFDTANKKTIDCIYRTYLWLAYSGIIEREIFSITKESVNLNNSTVMVNGVRHKLYKEGLFDIENACNLNMVWVERPVNSYYKPRVISNSILRGIDRSNDPYKPSDDDIKYYIRTAISKRLKESELNYSYKRIYESGIFFRAYMNEKSGKCVDFKNVSIYTVYGGLSAKNTKDIKDSSLLYQREFSLNNQYWDWKTVFDLL